MWSYYVVRGTHERAQELTDRCVALADSTQILELRAVAAAISGTQYVYTGRWQEAHRALRLATQAAGPAALAFPQDPALASRVLLAIVEWVRGDQVAAERELALALEGAAACSGRQAEFTRAYVYCFAAWYAQLIDAPERALGYAGQALQIAQKHQFMTWLGAAALHIAGAQCELGDFAAGLALFETALDQWQNAGARLMLPYFLGRCGRALLGAGRAEAGLEKLRTALELSGAAGEVFYDAELHRLYAEALAASAAPLQQVSRETDLAITIARKQQATAFEHRAQRVCEIVTIASNANARCQ
jgi:tetratricopeptide (TPR) repeat protein